MASSFTLEVTADNDDIRVGDTVEYTIVATNTGDGILQSPVMLFWVFSPDDWTYVSNDASMAHLTKSVGNTDYEYVYGSFFSGDFTTPREHPYYYYVEEDATLTLKVSWTALKEGSYSHLVYVLFDEVDGTHQVCYKYIAAQVLEAEYNPSPPPHVDDLPEITVTKTTEDSPTNVLENVTFTITVENTGSVDLENVVVTDILPTEMSYVSDDSDGSEVEDDEGNGVGMITWEIDNLGAGESQVISLVAQFDDGTRDDTYTDIVNVSGRGGDDFKIVSVNTVSNVVLDTQEFEIDSEYEVTTP